MSDNPSIGGPRSVAVGRVVAPKEVGKAPRAGNKKRKVIRNYELLVSASYIMLLGGHGSVAIASRVTGLHRDQIYRARQREWWPEVEAEAEQRWLANMDAEARRELWRLMKSRERKGKGKLAMEWLTKRSPALQPASKVEVSGPDGAPLQVIVGAVPAGLVRPEDR